MTTIKRKMGSQQPARVFAAVGMISNCAVLNLLLDTQKGLPYAARAVIRTQLGMPAETNVPPETVSTNAMTPQLCLRPPIRPRPIPPRNNLIWWNEQPP